MTLKFNNNERTACTHSSDHTRTSRSHTVQPTKTWTATRKPTALPTRKRNRTFAQSHATRPPTPESHTLSTWPESEVNTCLTDPTKKVTHSSPTCTHLSMSKSWQDSTLAPVNSTNTCIESASDLTLFVTTALESKKLLSTSLRNARNGDPCALKSRKTRRLKH